MINSTQTPAVVFTRDEVLGPTSRAAWHVVGTPLCLAFHLFKTIDALERVEFVHTSTKWACIARLRLRWTWVFKPWTRWRAWKTARYVIRAHKATGTMISVQFG